MFKKINCLVSCFILLNTTFSTLSALPSSSASISQEPQLTVKNRILAKVNGKAISVLDVMKKMDLVFHREYPELSGSIQARYQFYSQFWRDILNGMIDEELILANAAEMKLTASDGDARQELEELFGPKVVLNIDKLGLTYQEALKMINDELLVRKMDYFMVHSKAANRIGPKEVKAAYEIYAKEHPIEAAWTYEVVSIRSPHELNSAAVAEQAYQLLTKDKVPMDSLSATLKSKGMLKGTTVSVSEEFVKTDSAISSQHKDVLATMAIETYSKPVAQVSRADRNTVYRIFYLKKQTPAGVVPFAEVEEKIKAQLIEKVTEEESDLYHKKLRQRFGINDQYLSSMIPKDFEPFALTSAL
jgi:hypothetical protein